MVTQSSPSTPSTTSPLTFLSRILPSLISSQSQHYDRPFEAIEVSELLRLSHRYLEPSPRSQEYYQLRTPASTEVERIRSELDLDSVRIGRAEWRVDESDGIIVRVVLSNDAVDELAVLLKWERLGGGEGGETSESDWTYLTMELPSTRIVYSADLPAAIEEYSGSMQSAHYATPIDIVSSKPVQDMAEGEGTTPGAYGAADDFWSGYLDDDERREAVAKEQEEEEEYDEDEDNPTGFCLNAVNAQRNGNAESRGRYSDRERKYEAKSDEEGDYWNGYASDLSSAIGDSRYGETSKVDRYDEPKERESRSSHASDELSGGRRRSSTLRPTFTRSTAASPEASFQHLPALRTSDLLSESDVAASLLFSPSSLTPISLEPASALSSQLRQLDLADSDGLQCEREDNRGQVDKAEEAIEIAIRGVWQLYQLRSGKKQDQSARFIQIVSKVVASA